MWTAVVKMREREIGVMCGGIGGCVCEWLVACRESFCTGKGVLCFVNVPVTAAEHEDSLSYTNKRTH
jgi:hypothetical protein